MRLEMNEYPIDCIRRFNALRFWYQRLLPCRHLLPGNRESGEWHGCVDAKTAGLCMTCTVDVVLAAFNGESFLPAQIDSLLEQSYADWRLLIRDDLSSDCTEMLIRKYRGRYPDKVSVLDNQAKKEGVIGSFESLLNASTAPYVAFCDQDDVWMPNKLQLQIEMMRVLEAAYGLDVPLLVHTDLAVVDENLNLVGASFWKYQNLNPAKMSSLRRLLVQNCVTGCTVLINRALIERALPFPDGAIMHDWWLGLVAISEGIVRQIDAQTVKYRQHAGNDTGARRWDSGFVLGSVSERASQIQSLQKTRVQAEALLAAGVLNDKNSRIVRKYVSLYTGNWLIRRIEMLRGGFFKYGVLRNIAMFLRI